MAKKTTTSKRTSKAEKNSGVETNLVRRVVAAKKNTQIADFRSGDTVEVSVKVKEGDKERVQVYKGMVIKIQGSGVGRSFTVRKISSGIGVERTFPFRSPFLDKVEVITQGTVRRAKLYYLRGLSGKAAKIESELVVQGSSSQTSATESAT